MAKKKSKKKTSLWLKMLLGANFVLIIGILLSYVSYYFSPAKAWLPAFAGLAYPYILISNILFIVFWLFVRWKFTLFSVIAIVVGYSYLMSSIQFHSSKMITSKDTYFKVMSYNVRNFDLYSNRKNWKPNFEKRNNIFKFIQKEAPNVICFQEFVNDLSGRFKTLDTLVKLQKAINTHVEYTVVSRYTKQFGIATFTSFPIVNKGRINFPNSKTDLCIYTDIVVNTDTMRVYNAHFESLHFNYADFEFAEKITSAQTEDEADLKDKSMRLLRLMKRAFVKRALQAEMVAKHIKTCRYPVIVCTDMNDTPISYSYHQLSSNLHDAFTESGSGYGHTFNAFFPSFRIDYILLSDALTSANFVTTESENSDHYPIQCLVKKKSK